MTSLLDIKGEKYGRLTVLERAGHHGRRTAWRCLCDCGNLIVVTTDRLRRGTTKSCGCYNHDLTVRRNTKHGLARKSPLYGVWKTMRQRCNNPNNYDFIWYGAKGIKVCSEWDDYANFYEWSIKSGYEHGLTIDRNDSEGDYSPNNCRWATIQEQQRNKSHYGSAFENGIRKVSRKKLRKAV